MEYPLFIFSFIIHYITSHFYSFHVYLKKEIEQVVN